MHAYSTDKKELAERALASARFVTSAGFARADCPFCLSVINKEDRKQCLAISMKTGWFKCWRCGTTGRVDLTGPLPEVDEMQASSEGVGPPEGFMELMEEPAKSALCVEDARQYLFSRGMVDQTIWEAAKIGCCLSGRCAGRIVVPVLSPAGDWWGWVARAWTKKSDRPYLNAKGMTLGGGVFNHAALMVETQKPVLVMEGVFDALAYWPDAVAVLGKPKEDQIHSLIETPRPVAVVLDGDAWRESWTLAMRLRMEGQTAGFVRLPPEKDPDEVSTEWLWKEAQECLLT